ncbi:MAG TPA: PAS domain S-box protein [Xanthobacteraceae bacterium]|jgi:PAS domain S-box-containing protein|nr:PAS domain S-box protein [Xanthobacteraceae bacterium]
MTKGSDRRPSSSGDGVTQSCQSDVENLVDESVIAFGLDFHITAWNHEAERIYGWKRDEVVGRRIQSIVRCLPSQPLPSILEKVNQTGVWRGEFKRVNRSGAEVVVQAKWSMRRDQNGDPRDIVETGRDVLEARRTEEALARARRQYENLFQTSAVTFMELEFSKVKGQAGVLIERFGTKAVEYLGSNTTLLKEMLGQIPILDINEQGISLLGNGKREVLPNTLEAFWPEESLDKLSAMIVALAKGDASFSTELILRTQDGRRIDSQLTITPPPDPSEPAVLLAGFVDVTQAKIEKKAREQSDRRFREFFEFLPVALLHVDTRAAWPYIEEGRAKGVIDFAQYLRNNPDVFEKISNAMQIVEANREAVKFYRAQSVDELLGPVGRHWTESPDILRQTIAAHYSGKLGFNAQVKRRTYDGTLIDALFFAAFGPVTGEPNISFVGLIDITDRINAQEMLARLQEEMAHAARISVLGELAASIAHEVSQPLTAIQSNTEASLLWLRRQPPELDEIKLLAERTVSEVERAAGIIDRIRSMAVSKGIEFQALSFNSIVKEAVLFLRHELEVHSVQSKLHLASDLPEVLGDRIQLQQIVVNLSMNAIQAMVGSNSIGRGLRICTFLEKADVVIDVEDTGPGISPEMLPRLFQSFVTSKPNGMGMGLPICRSIVENHGGIIEAGNRLDGGARFRVRLPAHASPLAT